MAGIWKTESEEYEDHMNEMACDVGIGIEDLSDGDRVRLHPNASNPLHKRPVMATYSSGYFYCDGSRYEDGPDYYFGDVLTYNDSIERIVS